MKRDSARNNNRRRQDGPPKSRMMSEPRPRYTGRISFSGLDPRDAETLRRFMTEHGKIVPARLSGLSAKLQRRVKKVIRRARVVGIVP